MKIYLEIVKSKLPTNKPRIDFLKANFGWVHINLSIFNPLSFLIFFITVLKGLIHEKVFILTRMPALPLPFLLFFFLLPNLSIEHHAIFESERDNSSFYRRQYSFFTLILFKLLCRYKITHNICFSREIADHVISQYYAPSQSIFLTVNSHDPTPVLLDNRLTHVHTLTFMCGHFYPWQGLDLCISLVKELSVFLPVKLHLIGHLNNEQHDLINHYPFINHHGYLSNFEIDAILSETDVGLAPFALDRQGLSESSSLKCAYYLSRGVPVLSYFKDTRFHSDFYFYLADTLHSKSIHNIVNFILSCQNYTKQDVYSSSVEFWSHTLILKELNLLFD